MSTDALPPEVAPEVAPVEAAPVADPIVYTPAPVETPPFRDAPVDPAPVETPDPEIVAGPLPAPEPAAPPEFSTPEQAYAHIAGLRVELLALEQYAAAADLVGQTAGNDAAGHRARAADVQSELDRLDAEYPPIVDDVATPTTDESAGV